MLTKKIFLSLIVILGAGSTIYSSDNNDRNKNLSFFSEIITHETKEDFIDSRINWALKTLGLNSRKNCSFNDVKKQYQDLMGKNTNPEKQLNNFQDLKDIDTAYQVLREYPKKEYIPQYFFVECVIDSRSDVSCIDEYY